MSTIDQIASTPGFNAGSVDVQPSNTKVTKITKKVDNLQPGVTYTLLVRAKKNGQFSDYVSYQYTVPETDKSGNNFTVSNSNTDIQLLGGGFAASLSTDPLPINIGKINVTDTITAGTGVIMNQYGLAGYKAGTKTFYINARTGDAYFAGTLSASSITSGGGALSSDLANYAQVSALASYATKAGLGSTGYTTIHGGNITTGTIVSSGYVDGTDPYFSSAGTGINLDSGTFRAKQFGIDSSGNAKFAGSVTASAVIADGATFGSTTVSGVVSTANTANSTANTANGTANSAAAKTVNLDSLGRIINGVSIQNTGNIYSQKTTYLDDTNGWFLGWNSVGTYPVINIGNATNYIKWTPSSTLQINGTLTVGSGSTQLKVYDSSGGRIEFGNAYSPGYVSYDGNKIIVSSSKTRTTYPNGLQENAISYIWMDNIGAGSTGQSSIKFAAQNSRNTDGTLKTATETFINLNNVEGHIDFIADYLVFQSTNPTTTGLDATAIRNVYVSSTAGNPSPTSPQNGDIKLEW